MASFSSSIYGCKWFILSDSIDKGGTRFFFLFLSGREFLRHYAQFLFSMVGLTCETELLDNPQIAEMICVRVGPRILP